MNRNTSNPNYELLKDAYAILAGIPADAYDLSSIRERKGESLSCGTIACGFGWLGMHPQFQELGLKTVGYMELQVKGRSHGVGSAANKIFGISDEDGVSLFGTASYRRPEDWGRSHKVILLNRIMAYLVKKGQVKHPKYL